MDSYSKCICPETCIYFNSCENKVMAHEGLLDPPMLESATADAIQTLLEPVLRETMEINVYGTRMTVYKDDIKRMIYEPLTRHLGLMSGA